MNKVIDLAEYASSFHQEETEFTLFIEEVVALNKHLIADNIIKLKKDFDIYSIIETYANQCLAHGLKQKSSKWLISTIGNGSLFDAKATLINALLDDPVVKQVL